MKKLFFTLFGLILLISATALFSQDEMSITKGIKVKEFPFYIYHDGLHRKNNYIPSGWMGDYGDIKYNDQWKKNPKQGKHCIQIRYTGERKQGAGWAGIYWQNPANNWGTVIGGYDISGAKKLYFYARGEKGKEIVEFKMGGITGKFSDTGSATTGTLELKKTWELYEIDLTKVELNFIIGGFCMVVPGMVNPDGCTIYIDEIYYSKDKNPLKLSSK